MQGTHKIEKKKHASKKETCTYEKRHIFKNKKRTVHMKREFLKKISFVRCRCCEKEPHEIDRYAQKEAYKYMKRDQSYDRSLYIDICEKGTYKINRCAQKEP